MRIAPTLITLTLAAALAACGGGDAPADNAAANDMNLAMAEPTGPFGAAEMAMDSALLTAVGVDAGDSWVKKMIAHHQGAIEMSRIVLGLSPSADVAMMAQATIDKQGAEVTALEKLTKTGTPDAASGELYRAATTTMHEAMMAASGADVSETYLKKMLAHHQGAVAMSDVALANGVSGAVRTQVEKTRADQLKEIAMVEAMLRGEPMNHTAMPEPAPAPKAAVAPKAAPAPAPKPAPKAPAPAKPKPAPAPAPAPDPHAGHDMNKM